MPYLYNAWYVAAWSSDVTEAFFPRKLLDIPVLLFRDPEGKAVAFHDACPHRFAPLSSGTFVDGKVRCGYHGLEFDTEGNCVGSCINAVTAPKAAKVRTFPIVEQDTMIWIWMGDPAAADPAGIMRFPYLVDPEMIVATGTTHARANYLLFSDNLLDFTHVSLLHPMFGGLKYQPKFKSREDGDDIVSEYTAELPASMIIKTPHYEYDTIRWRAPGVHDLMTSMVPKDETVPRADFPAAHIVTPETRLTTHYFWGAAVPKAMPITEEQLRTQLQFAFDQEDKPMIESIQERMGDHELAELDPMLLNTDASAVRARRKLEALIAEERKGRAAVAAE